MKLCEHAGTCAFFTRAVDGEDLANFFKEIYCHDNFGRCARYRVALAHGRETVGEDIFPNEHDFVSVFSQAGRPRHS